LGRHTKKLTVFADATGSRTRALRIGIRTAAAALVAGTVLVLITLLSGVPMPGFTRPVRLPTTQPAAQQGNHRTSAVPTPQAAFAVSSSPADETRPTHAAATPARPSSPAAAPTLTPASVPTTPQASAPSSAPAQTHGNKPPTPPGHTRHP
jgi:hypothetical protein